MRLPPPKLADLLVRLEACSSADFSRAARTVQTLCRDLPDFDSVWLDALVQLRVLTPWQSEILQSEEPDRLRVGRYLLREVLGTCTFAAHHLDTGQRVAAVQVQSPETDDVRSIDFLNRLANLTESADHRRGGAPVSIILPREVVSLNEASHSLIFPWVDGWSCDELLIRGGRLPAGAVAEIGRDLLSAMVWLEGHQLLHGDITLRNVRLARNGTAVFVCPFVRRLCWPKVSLTDQLSLRDCDGVAPEQIGTGRSPDVRSELHSLGCVLWQMLTSRPVILDADPVSRLIKIRDQDIIDVRTYAPECPEWMARLILQMTRRSPELRSQSASDLLKTWRQHSGGGRGAVRSLVSQLPEVAVGTVSVRKSSAKTHRSSSRLLSRSMAAVALVGLVVGLSRLGYIPQSLHWDRYSTQLQELTNSLSGQPSPPREPVSEPDDVRMSNIAGSDAGRGAEGHTNGLEQPITIPEPDAEGIIRLQNGRTYLSRVLDYPDSEVRLEVAEGPPARILVTKSAWKVRTRSFELRNVMIVDGMKDQPASGPGLLVLSAEQFRSDLMLLRNTTFGSGVAWIPVGANARAELKRTILLGQGHGIRCSRVPSELVFENCVLGSDSSAISCEVAATESSAKAVLRSRFRNVVLKSAPAVFDLVIRETSLAELQLILEGNESVLCPEIALARIAAPEGWETSRCQVDFKLSGTGNPVIVPPETRTVVFFDPRLKSYVEASASQVKEDCLLIAQPAFTEIPGQSLVEVIKAHELADFEGPKLTTEMPGVRFSGFPAAFWQSITTVEQH